MPMDVVKSRIQTAAPGTKDSQFAYVFMQLLKNEGPAALYKGFGAVMIRALPCNAIGFYLYDLCFKFLNERFPG